MKRWLAGVPYALTLAAAGSAHAATPSPIPANLVEGHFHQGVSVGSPTDGHLIGGSRLEEAPYLRFLPAYASEHAWWGLGTLVSMIDRSARAVRHQFPDAILSVGHLSRSGGGDIDRHASHESGRDADLSFFIKNQAGHPLYSDHMVSFRGDGSAPSWPGALFDDARNWALVAALVQDPHARATYIFVATPLRARLLEYAQHIGAPLAVRNKAAELMVQPRGSLPHDDHFHVRIACPSGMTACVELPRAKSTHMMAHHRTKASSPSVASNRTTAPHPGVVHPVTPVVPADSPGHPIEPSPDPSVSAAAVLAQPFDDADGPPESALSPAHLDIL
jgi:penicillin-insensitive murein endopeptidase